MSAQDSNKRKQKPDFELDAPNGCGRLCVLTATLLNHSHERAPPMPLTVDNKLPGCELRFGRMVNDEVSIICHVDACAAMSTGNLGLHQWIMTKYPGIVAKYIQYDNAEPFEPIKLAVALQDLDGCDSMKSKLTAIVRYWTPYMDQDNKHQLISFGLGECISVNSIIGLPQLRAWQASVCFHTNFLLSMLLKRQFPLIYEPTKIGVTSGEAFHQREFIRPSPISPCNVLVTNLDRVGINDSSRHESKQMMRSVESTSESRIVKLDT